MAYILNSGMSPRNFNEIIVLPLPKTKNLTVQFFLENGIPIEGWISEAGDEALLYLLPFLDALRFTEDVRSVLRLRGGISTRSF
jgi:TFIIF-interacting CTD phosphatase-like protein